MSSWYAIAALQDARDATEELLWPPDRGRWLRLAVIALFVGVGSGAPTGGGNANVPSGAGGGGGGAPPDLPAPAMPDPGTTTAIVVGVAVALLLLFVLWSLAGAVMEFVLVTGLRDREVRIRRPFRANLGPGLRLFAFRLVVGLGSLLLIAVPLILVIGLGMSLSLILLLLIVPLVVLFGLVALIGSVVLGLTTDFAVPSMLVEDRGVLDAWRRLWPTLRAEWKQVGLYVVAKFVLGVAVGLAVSLVVLLAALIVAIPFVLVGGGAFVAASSAGAPQVGWVIGGVLVAAFVLVMIVVGLLIQVPALTFVRYYSLSVLGMLIPELDLVGVDRPDEDSDGEGADGDGFGGDDGDGFGGGGSDGDGADRGDGEGTDVREADDSSDDVDPTTDDGGTRTDRSGGSGTPAA